MKKMNNCWIYLVGRLTKRVMVTLFLITVILVFYSSLCFGQAVFEVTIDEHETPLPTEGGYYNLTGGDRGVLNAGDISFSRDGDSSYKVESIGGTWGAMWYSPIRNRENNIPLDFNAIFGPYIKPEYQGQIIGAELIVNNASSPSNNPNLELRLEFKNKQGEIVYVESWTDLSSGNYPKTCTVSLNPPQIDNVQEIVWVMDHAQAGDAISVDRVRLKARVPEMPTEEQAFLWTYSWLITNYDPDTGMVQNRSNFGSGNMENITATAKAAKLTYYAYQKGYVTYEHAVEIITKIANTLINVVPRGPSGVNTLWPHFTRNGGTEALPPHNSFDGTEWASGDTAYAALDMITALQLLGDPQNQLDDLVKFLQEIDWEALLKDGGISHGYSYEGEPLSSVWKSFGLETIGVNWAYASATGNVAVMTSPPSDNGAGFIDNAHYPMVLSGRDRWCNDWDTYRSEMADIQIGWYCTQEHGNEFLCDAGLYGLSEAETPEGVGYVAYGVGGSTIPPEDGNGEVITLHYSGMIADIRPEASRNMWEVLRDRSPELLPESLHDRVIISPLNNMESMRVNRDTGEPIINHMKGSWNLAFQAEGWAYADPDIRNAVLAAIEENSFLNAGYTLVHLGCESADLEFSDWEFDLNGKFYQPGDTLPDYFDDTAFDWGTGRGAITIRYETGTAGDYFISLSFDYLFSCTTPECYTLSEETIGTLEDGQLLGIEIDEYNVTANLGWNFSLTGDTDWAELTFILGETFLEEPYSVFSYTSICDEEGHFYISSEINTIPEPSTILLLSCGLIGVFALARRTLKKGK